MGLVGPLEGPRFTPGGPGGVGRPFRKSSRPFQRSVRPTWKFGRVRKALLEVWVGSKVPSEGLGGPSGGPRGHPGGSAGVGRPTRRSKRGQQALPEVLEALPNVQDGSVGPPTGLGGVGRPFQRYRWGREALLEVPGALMEVQEATSEVRLGLGGSPASPGWVGRLFRRSRMPSEVPNGPPRSP